MSVTRLMLTLELTVYEIGKGSREFSEFHQKFNGIVVPDLNWFHVAAIVAAATTIRSIRSSNLTTTRHITEQKKS